MPSDKPASTPSSSAQHLPLRPGDPSRNRQRPAGRETIGPSLHGFVVNHLARVHVRQRHGRRLIREHPHHLGHFLVSRPFREEVVGDQRATLSLLFGAVILMLIIICANLGNLTLARAEGRQREMAVRASIGAGRGWLIQQTVI